MVIFTAIIHFCKTKTDRRIMCVNKKKYKTAMKRPHNWHQTKDRKRVGAQDAASSGSASEDCSSEFERVDEGASEDEHDDAASVNMSDMEEAPVEKKEEKGDSDVSEEASKMEECEDDDEEEEEYDDEEGSASKRKQYAPRLSKMQMLRKQHNMEVEASRKLRMTMLGRNALKKGVAAAAPENAMLAKVQETQTAGSDWEDDEGDEDVSEHALFGTSNDSDDDGLASSCCAGPKRERADS